MTGIEEALAGPLRPRTEIVTAYADTWPNIIVGGVTQFAAWVDNCYPAVGEPVTVAREVDPAGFARNIVLGRLDRPGATEGTVLSTDGTKALVSVGAEEVTAAYDPDKTFTPGDTVRIIWQGRVATVAFKLTSYVPPPAQNPGTTAPPPANSTGRLPALATDSATWTATLGYWNVWAQQNQKVYTGSYGGHTTTGSWFYNGTTKQLAGATIVKVMFRVPKRLPVGSFNSAGTLHIYVHTSDTRPGGDVARVLGPYDVSIPAGWTGEGELTAGNPAGFVTLPNEAGTQLINGGGISVAGDPYMGFAGKAEDPASGQLLIDWQR